MQNPQKKATANQSRLRLCQPLVRKNRAHCHCITTDKPPKLPDPAIYSQSQRLSLGQISSWESPDIKTNFWEPWRFKDNIEVIVHNESSEASAVNALVQVSWAQFGIGTSFSPLGSQLINLGIGPSQQELLFPVNEGIKALGNQVSIRVDISHPHDKNSDNNTGYQTIHGVNTSEAGKSPSVDFVVVNDRPSIDTINLVVQANDINATVTPTSHVFAANEQITATLSTNIPASIVPPAGGHILKEATVIAYNSSGNMLGGITLLVRVDS